MCARGSAHRKQRVNVLSQAATSVPAEVEIVQRQGDRPHAARLEQVSRIFRDGGLSRALRAAEAEDRRAFAIYPPAMSSCRQRFADKLGCPAKTLRQAFRLQERVKSTIAQRAVPAVAR